MATWQQPILNTGEAREAGASEEAREAGEAGEVAEAGKAGEAGQAILHIDCVTNFH